jgi:hypothetical protein
MCRRGAWGSGLYVCTPGMTSTLDVRLMRHKRLKRLMSLKGATDVSQLTGQELVLETGYVQRAC